MTDQKELDRQWIRKLASETKAVRLGQLIIRDALMFEEILERNGVNTDDLTGEENLSELSTMTGLFAYLYEVQS